MFNYASLSNQVEQIAGRIGRSRWLLPLIGVGIILPLSVLIGISPTPLFLVPVAAVAGAILLLREPSIGLLAVIGAALLVPFALGTGTGSTINAAMLTLGALGSMWVVDMVARQRQIELPASRTVRPLLAFLVVGLLSLVVGQLPWFAFVQRASLAAQIGGYLIFVLSALAYIWVGKHLRDVRWLQVAVWLFLGISGLHIVTSIFSFLPEISLVRGVVNGSVFWIWVFALAFGQLVFNQKLSPGAKGLLVAGLALAFVVAYFQEGEWKSGWIPGLVAMGVILFFYAPRLTFILGLVLLIPLIIWGSSLIADESYSYTTRVEAWALMVNIIKVNPLLGVGPSNYYYYTPLFPIRGYAVNYSSHNQYIDLLGQTGILGLLSYLWFMAEVAFVALSLRTKVPDGFPRAFVYSALGALAAMLFAGMLGDWVLPFVYNVGFPGFRASVIGWLFLGGILALEQMTDGRSVEGKSTQ